MEYGYYDGLSDIFNSTDMEEPYELAASRLREAIEAAEEQLDELARELAALGSRLESIREDIGDRFGGE